MHCNAKTVYRQDKNRKYYGISVYFGVAIDEHRKSKCLCRQTERLEQRAQTIGKGRMFL